MFISIKVLSMISFIKNNCFYIYRSNLDVTQAIFVLATWAINLALLVFLRESSTFSMDEQICIVLLSNYSLVGTQCLIKI
jgi:hypothetical protein